MLKLKTENWKYYNKIIFKCVNNIVEPNFNEKITQKWDLWICILFTELTKLIKMKSQPLPATVHINSNRCPLNECAVAEKKKKSVKKRRRKRKNWIQTQPILWNFSSCTSFSSFSLPYQSRLLLYFLCPITFLFYIYLCSLPNDSLVCYNLLWFFNFLRSPII